MIESFKLPNITPETLTGSIVSFNDEYGGLPLKSCTSLITGYQEGSGTPSPDNVRPLHAFSSANIGQTSGYVEYFCGLLKGTYGFVDLGSLQYFLTPSGLFQTNSLVGIIKNASSSSIPANVLAQGYTTIDSQSITGPQGSTPSPNMVMAENINSVLFFNNTSYTDATAFKTAMSGVYLIYELATPTTPTITPEQFATLCQAFGITGNTYTFTFGQSIYHGYIDWKRGVVVGTHKKLVLTSSNNWQKSNTYQGAFFMYWGYFDDIGKSSVPFLCDRAKSVMSTSDYVYGTCFSDAACGIRIMPENSTIQDWFDYLDAQVSAGTPVTIAYELATPIEIPLGGINLLTQQGVNNIFCDTGDTTLEWLKVN